MDPLLRFRRLRLATNPFETLEPARFLDVIPTPPGLEGLLAEEWRALQFCGKAGSGKTTRLRLSVMLRRGKGASCGMAWLDPSGSWRWEDGAALEGRCGLLALDFADAEPRACARAGLPREAARAGQLLLAARAPLETVPGHGPPRIVQLARVEPAEIQAYYRARVDAVSTGPMNRYALTPEALHRLANLSEGNYYRLNRILYQAFEGLVRDEPLEEKAIERGYGGFLLEEQESAPARGTQPVLK